LDRDFPAINPNPAILNQLAMDVTVKSDSSKPTTKPAILENILKFSSIVHLLHHMATHHTLLQKLTQDFFIWSIVT